jgi:F-type H+-transporting ATPase subunit epsilon
MTTIKPGVVSVKLASGQVNKYVVFGGFADILPDSCTLLAESAVPATELTVDTLQKRIEAVQNQINNAQSDEHKTKLEQFLSELTHLHGAGFPG